MRFFLDFEFIERGAAHPILPLSLGLVDEAGAGCCLEFERTPAEMDSASDWVKANVFPHLLGIRNPRERLPLHIIRERIVSFALPASEPEFWGYYADYDWVLFAQLFGTMMDLPRGYPFFCRDLHQLSLSLDAWKDRERLYPSHGTEHDALADARWNRELFLKLKPLADAKGTKV